jgi:DNA-directed RNA polymerase subunit RPC12/RpoP
MMNTPKRCSRCQGALGLAVLEPFSGEESGVRMSVEGLPALECAEGHRRFLAPDFPNHLMEALLTGEPLVPVPAAVQKGLLRKRYHCASCGQALEAQPDGDVEAVRVLEVKGSSPFGVRVEAPKFRCAACGKESGMPERAMLDALLKASVNGFRTARIDPN